MSTATKDSKVNAILQGAMEEFLVNGYAGTSMDKVATAAGVSKATVYNHFQDKETLFLALIEQFTAERMGSFFNHQPPISDLAIALKTVAYAILDRIEQDPSFIPFMRLLIAESGRFPTLGKAFIHRMESRGLRVIEDYLKKHLDLPDPEAASRIFIGSLVHYMIIQEMLHGKNLIPFPRERLVESLVELLCPRCSVTQPQHPLI
jgi:AcrR family transcriptional regulator